MKKFIAFIIVMLPLTAVLSMGAGFWYAANTRRVPVVMDALVMMSEPPLRSGNSARIVPTVASVQIPTQPAGNASLLRIQLSFCFESWQTLIKQSRLRDVEGMRICADNLRRLDAPPALREDVQALATQFTSFADEYEAALRNTDPAKMDAAGTRVQPIGGMLKRMLDALPE